MTIGIRALVDMRVFIWVGFFGFKRRHTSKREDDANMIARHILHTREIEQEMFLPPLLTAADVLSIEIEYLYE